MIKLGLRYLIRSAVKQLSEFVFDGLGEIVKVLDEFFLWHGWVQVLHSLESVDNSLGEGFFDKGHGDLSFGLLRFEKDLLAVLVVSADTLHHTNGLPEWAVVIILGESILLHYCFGPRLCEIWQALPK